MAGQRGVKIVKKSAVPGVTITQFVDSIPEGCSAPDFERKPITLTLQEGKNAIFRAVVKGEPKPEVVWKRNNREMVDDPQKCQISFKPGANEFILQITKITSDDADLYRCTAVNEYGEATCTAGLKIIQVGFKKKAKEAPSAPQGDLKKEIQDFRKTLKKRAPSTAPKKELDKEQVWQLLLNADRKDYEKICLKYGVVDFRGMLRRLQEMKKEREDKQALYVNTLTNLRHVSINREQGNASFDLEMELKNPESRIYLYKDGQMIHFEFDSDTVKHCLRQVGKKYNFIINDLQPEDAGVYQIKVEDVDIFSTELEAETIPMSFRFPLGEVRCHEQGNAVFQCVLYDPCFNAVWLHKDRRLEPSDKYDISASNDGLTHRLVIKNTQYSDKGTYTIDIGTRSSSAWLEVEGAKGKRKQAEGDNEAKAGWQNKRLDEDHAKKLRHGEGHEAQDHLADGSGEFYGSMGKDGSLGRDMHAGANRDEQMGHFSGAGAEGNQFAGFPVGSNGHIGLGQNAMPGGIGVSGRAGSLAGMGSTSDRDAGSGGTGAGAGFGGAGGLQALDEQGSTFNGTGIGDRFSKTGAPGEVDGLYGKKGVLGGGGGPGASLDGVGGHHGRDGGLGSAGRPGAGFGSTGAASGLYGKDGMPGGFGTNGTGGRGGLYGEDGMLIGVGIAGAGGEGGIYGTNSTLDASSAGRFQAGLDRVGELCGKDGGLGGAGGSGDGFGGAGSAGGPYGKDSMLGGVGPSGSCGAGGLYGRDGMAAGAGAGGAGGMGGLYGKDGMPIGAGTGGAGGAGGMGALYGKDGMPIGAGIGGAGGIGGIYGKDGMPIGTGTGGAGSMGGLYGKDGMPVGAGIGGAGGMGGLYGKDGMPIGAGTGGAGSMGGLYGMDGMPVEAGIGGAGGMGGLYGKDGMPIGAGTGGAGGAGGIGELYDKHGMPIGAGIGGAGGAGGIGGLYGKDGMPTGAGTGGAGSMGGLYGKDGMPIGTDTGGAGRMGGLYGKDGMPVGAGTGGAAGAGSMGGLYGKDGMPIGTGTGGAASMDGLYGKDGMPVGAGIGGAAGAGSMGGLYGKDGMPIGAGIGGAGSMGGLYGKDGMPVGAGIGGAGGAGSMGGLYGKDGMPIGAGVGGAGSMGGLYGKDGMPVGAGVGGAGGVGSMGGLYGKDGMPIGASIGGAGGAGSMGGLYGKDGMLIGAGIGGAVGAGSMGGLYGKDGMPVGAGVGGAGGVGSMGGLYNKDGMRIGAGIGGAGSMGGLYGKDGMPIGTGTGGAGGTGSMGGFYGKDGMPIGAGIGGAGGTGSMGGFYGKDGMPIGAGTGGAGGTGSMSGFYGKDGMPIGTGTGGAGGAGGIAGLYGKDGMPIGAGTGGPGGTGSMGGFYGKDGMPIGTGTGGAGGAGGIGGLYGKDGMPIGDGGAGGIAACGARGMGGLDGKDGMAGEAVAVVGLGGSGGSYGKDGMLAEAGFGSSGSPDGVCGKDGMLGGKAGAGSAAGLSGRGSMLGGAGGTPGAFGEAGNMGGTLDGGGRGGRLGSTGTMPGQDGTSAGLDGAYGKDGIPGGAGVGLGGAAGKRGLAGQYGTLGGDGMGAHPDGVSAHDLSGKGSMQGGPGLSGAGLTGAGGTVDLHGQGAILHGTGADVHGGTQGFYGKDGMRGGAGADAGGIQGLHSQDGGTRAGAGFGSGYDKDSVLGGAHGAGPVGEGGVDGLYGRDGRLVGAGMGAAGLSSEGGMGELYGRDGRLGGTGAGVRRMDGYEKMSDVPGEEFLGYGQSSGSYDASTHAGDRRRQLSDLDASGLASGDLSRTRSRKARGENLLEEDVREPHCRFSQGLLDVHAQKGKSAVLSCSLNNDQLEGTWFKDGFKITGLDGVSIEKDGAIHKLIIDEVQDRHAGKYKFEAEGIKTEASVLVEDPPNVDAALLKKLSKEPVVVKAGKNAMVKIPFEGRKPIRAVWLKDDGELLDDARINTEHSDNFTRLSISSTNRKDCGDYKVKLRNESGTLEAALKLVVIDKPQPPMGPIEVVDCSTSGISIKWKPPKDDGGKPVQTYTIEKQQVGRKTWVTLGETKGDDTIFTTNKVEHDKSYYFRVKAVNAEGTSEALESDEVMAAAKVFPGPPAPPKIVSAYKGAITLSWAAPHKTGNSRILGYTVEKCKKGSNFWTPVTDLPITDRKYTVTDLKEGLQYEFRVAAVNAAGVGEASAPSEAVFARDPMNPPGPVRGLKVTNTDYSSISLSWMKPELEEESSAKGYIVEMRHMDTLKWNQCNSLPIGMTTYIVRGLKAREMYFLRVRAVNDGGFGDPVELDTCIQAVPPTVHPKLLIRDSIKNFMIIKAGDTIRMRIPFEASPAPEVIWQKDGLALPAKATMATREGLSQLIIPGADFSDSGHYAIILRTESGKKESFSFLVQVTDVPESPGPIQLVENVPETVTLIWEPSPTEKRVGNLNYMVMQRDSSKGSWQVVADLIYTNKCTVANFVPGREYFFRVLAKNYMGISEPSETVQPWSIHKTKGKFEVRLPKYKGVNQNQPPRFLVQLKPHVVTLGFDCHMSCAVTGYPVPRVTWYKDSKNLSQDPNFFSKNDFGVCSLVIPGVTPSDGGEYKVVASNKLGQATSKAIVTIKESFF
ncbi:immunoglobulin-like and fibronectin type III domain-containing protein 1 [Hemicordylus capensis]|uniref:immunoglobulin-like and fibronectin type III domain-containing protein 1 n=1 Tax=Hemicordylus capensis TaxID=884348 RepID=UPI0023028A8B|nr:immunoglobulin-like and fibronectin type III domain-containing protein 1 [Hemicordylus capensis]